MRISPLGLALFLGLVCRIEAAYSADSKAPPGAFDFAHVELAIEYFEAPSDELIEKISRTEAASHLKRHSDRTGYYPADARVEDISRELLEKPPSEQELAAVVSLVEYARANPSRQAECISTAAAYLPEGAQPVNPVHITWGYDIGVAMDDHASLNFAHPHFLADPEEVWFYCIHEVHHSGLMQIHPMPRVSAIDSVAELHGFVRYATFIEGLAVHAARNSREHYGALGGDPDYVALGDEALVNRFVGRYQQSLEWLESEFGKPLGEGHWQIVEDLSSGDRLWYVVGAAMAAAIEKSNGLDSLLEIQTRGADAFFAAYRAAPGH